MDAGSTQSMLSSLRKIFTPQRTATYHRRWPRILMSEPARVTVGRNAPQGAMLEEICAGGARVKMPHRLAPGTLIGIDFKTSAVEQTHNLNAVVVHAHKDERGFNWHCGLSFVDVTPQHTQRLAGFVEAERNRRAIGFATPRA